MRSACEIVATPTLMEFETTVIYSTFWIAMSAHEKSESYQSFNVTMSCSLV